MHTHSDATFRSPAVLAAFRTLSEARRYAQQLQRNVWEFAVPVKELKELGCTGNILRLLVLTSYAETAIVHSGVRRRSSNAIPLIQDDSSFVLTESGMRIAASLGVSANGHSERKQEKPIGSLRPSFRNRVLSVGNQIIKKFRQPAKIQELVLLAFEEQAWDKEIDDPLSPAPEIDPKLRLRRTIDNLNRHQQVPLIHFYGDGTGQKIGWEWRS